MNAEPAGGIPPEPDEEPFEYIHPSKSVDPERLLRAQRNSVTEGALRLRPGQGTLPEKAMTRYEAAPYPDPKVMPVDTPDIPVRLRWNAKRWEAYCLLHEGHTTAQTAKKIGVYLDTVTRYRTRWRERYGITITAERIEHVNSDPRYRKPGGTDAVTLMASEEFDHLARQSRSVVSVWLGQFEGVSDESRERIQGLSHAEVKAIQDIGLTAQKASIEMARAKADGIVTDGSGASAERSAASKAMDSLGRSKPKGPKGQAAESTGAVVHDLRAQLKMFRDARGEDII